MDAMPRPRPPFLLCETTRHGKTVWYVRAPGPDGKRGPRIRIRGDYGSPEFRAAYQAALQGESLAPARGRPAAGTLAWLISRYRDSAAWAALKPATRKQRENIFLHVCKGAGDFPFARTEKRHIAAGRDRRAVTPAAANNYLKTMRALFSWAVEADLMPHDPTRDVKRLSVRTEGFHTWTEEEIQQFEARWPLGTRERLALAVLLYTGLRRGDAVRLGRQHIREAQVTGDDGRPRQIRVISMATEKTGARIVVPVLPELQEAIDAAPSAGLSLIARHDGQPMVKEGFGNWFREACKAAGVPGSAHGLRKAGATRLANNGATERMLNAIYGWADGSKESATYTRTADRERLARMAIEMLTVRKDDAEATIRERRKK